MTSNTDQRDKPRLARARHAARPVVLALALWLCGGLTPAPIPAAEPSPSPAADPARGLVYRGLQRADAGACRGGFRVDDAGRTPRCTHGPDPAPRGMDVRKAPSVAELQQESPPTARVAVPCHGDGQSGDRLEVIYARASDRPDRYGEMAPLIADWAGDMAVAVQESAAETGGFRTLRFLTAGCQLVVRNVTLSESGDDTLPATARELEAMGYSRADRDYVIFADAAVYCGIGYINWRYARVDTRCWTSRVALHETIHNLGGVQLAAPNATAGWHCTDESDVMCYSDAPNFPPMRQVCPPSHERLLDCNHDDYFSTAPPASNWLSTNPGHNTADSSYMAEADGRVPVLLPRAPDSYRGPRYVVRANNADDDLCIYGQNPGGPRVRFYCVGYRGDRTADITGALLAVAGAAPTVGLRLVASDRGANRTFGFTVWKDGVPILNERGGELDVSSSTRPLSGADPLTGWPVFYDRTMELALTVPPEVVPPETPPAVPASPPGGGTIVRRGEYGVAEASACNAARAKLAGAQRSLRRLERRLVRDRRRLRLRRARLTRAGWPAGPSRRYAVVRRSFKRRQLRKRRQAREVSSLKRQASQRCG